MVRLGMLIYGQFTPDLVRKKIGLKPALRWEASVVDIKHLEAGEGVSYDHTFITTNDHDTHIYLAWLVFSNLLGKGCGAGCPNAAKRVKVGFSQVSFI